MDHDVEQIEALQEQAARLAKARKSQLAFAVVRFCDEQLHGEQEPLSLQDEAWAEALLEQCLGAFQEGEFRLAQIGCRLGAELTEDLPLLHARFTIGLMTACALLDNMPAVLEVGLGSFGLTLSREASWLSAEARQLAELSELAEQSSEAGLHGDAERLYVALSVLVERLDDPALKSHVEIELSINQAIHLDRSGRCEEADAQFRHAQQLLDAAPDGEGKRERQVLLRLNHVRTLSSIDRHEEAERVASAGELDDADDYPRHRARLAKHRADNLRAWGKYDQAEGMYALALERLLAAPDATADEFASLHLARAANALTRDEDASPHLRDARARLASAPDSDEVSRLRAAVTMSEAVALHRSGLHVEAEDLYAQAQQAFDALPPSGESVLDCALVRVNRGDNLDSLGHREAAEACYAEAQAWLDQIARDSPRVRVDRGRVRVNRANTLSALGRRVDAEPLYREADAIFETIAVTPQARVDLAAAYLNHGSNLQALGELQRAEDRFAKAWSALAELTPTQEVRAHRAAVSLNRGNNCNLLADHGLAEVHLSRAQALYDELPATEGVRVSRVLCRANRLANLLGAGRSKPAAELWSESYDLLLELQGHPGPSVLETVKLLLSSLFELCPRGQEHQHYEERARALCAWALDWLDIVADPSSAQPVGAEQVDAVSGVTLSWLLAHDAVERVPELLAECFGRYAFAQKLAVEASGDPTLDPLVRLRGEVRRLSGELQALEANPASLLENSSLRVRRDDVLTRRANLVRELKASIRERRGAESLTFAVTLERLQRALRRAPGTAARALVVLFRVEEPDDDVALGLRTTRRPYALLVREAEVRLVKLPDAVLSVLASTSTSAQASRVSRRRDLAVARLDGRKVLRQVNAAWLALREWLDEAAEVFVAVHQELCLLPWQAGEGRESIRLLYGIQAACEVLERGVPAARIAPPTETRALGTLAHSPTGSELEGEIPCVYVDQVVSARAWAGRCRTLSGRTALLTESLPLIQLSCHGSAAQAHTGPAQGSVSAYEFQRAISTRAEVRLEAILIIACSSAQAGTNGFGESAGWPAVLQGNVDAVLGALHPVDDEFSSLFVLLLHRAWANTGDLRAALRETRTRMRSGAWTDNAADDDVLLDTWRKAIATALQGASGCEAVLERAQDFFRTRKSLYNEDASFRLTTESFVIAG